MALAAAAQTPLRNRAWWAAALLMLLIGATSCARKPGASASFAPTGKPALALDFSRPLEDTCQIDSELYGDFYCVDGELHLVHAGRPSGSVAGYFFNPASLDGAADVMLQARMRSVGGSGSYGLQFRTTSNTLGYAFVVRPAGYFRLIFGLPPEELIAWQRSSAIRQGNSTNLLQVIVQGTRITLFANGTMLAALDDTRASAGWPGVLAMDGGHAAVSEFKVWVLP